MPANEYAAYTCVGLEGEKYLLAQADSDGGFGAPRVPFKARASENLNLGPVTCLAGAVSVRCTENAAPYHSFSLSSTAFSSPLLPGDAVAVAADPASEPTIPVTSGIARPTTWGGSDFTFKNVEWTEWTNNLAIGAGDFSYNTCQPACADGNYAHDANVTLVFEDPTVICGQWFFSHWEVQDTANPSRSGSSQGFNPTVYRSSSTAYCLDPSGSP